MLVIDLTPTFQGASPRGMVFPTEATDEAAADVCRKIERMLKVRDWRTDASGKARDAVVLGPAHIDVYPQPRRRRRYVVIARYYAQGGVHRARLYHGEDAFRAATICTHYAVGSPHTPLTVPSSEAARIEGQRAIILSAVAYAAKLRRMNNAPIPAIRQLVQHHAGALLPSATLHTAQLLDLLPKLYGWASVIEICEPTYLTDTTLPGYELVFGEVPA